MISRITFVDEQHDLSRVKPGALAGAAQWSERGLGSNGSPVQLPIKAHAWVVG